MPAHHHDVDARRVVIAGGAIAAAVVLVVGAIVLALHRAAVDSARREGAMPRASYRPHGTLPNASVVENVRKCCEQARRDSYDIMVRHAQELGANAIIAVRYDANEVSQGVTEVLAYGTAVVVE